MTELVKAEGMVHMMNPVNGEFTICGDAFDLASDVPGYEQTVVSSNTTVTCPNCATIIHACRNVKRIMRS